MSKSGIKLIFLGLILSLTAGCVYFNTFYNANQYFKQAEKLSRSPNADPTRQQIELYDKVIERCARVIRDHKSSKYVDDALFLMGKSFLAKGESQKAIDTFEQLVVNYPRSGYVDEASLLIGQAYYSVGDQDQALAVFQSTVENYPHRSFAVRAQFLIADILFVNEDYEGAIAEYEKVLTMKAKGPLVGETTAQLGECHYHLKNYQQAEAYLGLAAQNTEDRADRAELMFKQGDALIALERYQEAQRVFEQIEKESNIAVDKTRSQIQIARTKMHLDEPGAGWEMLSKIAEENKNSASGAEANYYMGEYILETADYDSARAYFDQASRGSAGTDIGLKATSKKNELDRLLSLQSGQGSRHEIAANFTQLGEVYYMEQGNIRLALNAYQTVIDSFPDTEYMTNALYAQAFILEHEQGLIDSADAIYTAILQQYPDSPHADALRRRFGLPVPKRPFIIPEPEVVEKPAQETTPTGPESQPRPLPSEAADRPVSERLKDIAWPEGTIMDDSVATDSTPVNPALPAPVEPAVLRPDSLLTAPADFDTLAIAPAVNDSGGIPQAEHPPLAPVVDEPDSPVIAAPDSVDIPPAPEPEIPPADTISAATSALSDTITVAPPDSILPPVPIARDSLALPAADSLVVPAEPDSSWPNSFDH